MRSQLLGLFFRGGASLCFTDRSFYRSANAIKLAIVGSRLAFIYRGSGFHQLSEETAWQETVVASGYLWIADRRQPESITNTATERYQDRRRSSQLLVVLCWLLGVSNMLAASVNAQTTDWVAGYYASSVSNATVVRSLNLFAVDMRLVEPNDARQGIANNFDNSSQNDFEREHYQKALAIILKKWRSTRNDPPSMGEDLDRLAKYIASQPEVYTLLLSLRDEPLKLSYSPNQFETVVKGSQFFVRSVNIRFDPRSAAVLAENQQCEKNIAHCIASPADAFIHELIHAKIALLETRQFVRHGGLSNALYPYKHEQEVLKRERTLYGSMTAVDNLPRPIRRSHSGSLQLADCVTCITAN